MTRTDTSPADVVIDETKLTVLRNSIEKDIENGLSDGSVIVPAALRARGYVPKNQKFAALQSIDRRLSAELG